MSDETDREPALTSPPGSDGEALAATGDSDEAESTEVGLEPRAFDEVDVRDWLRRATERESVVAPSSVLKDVQRRLRDESKGQYFSDGWGTAPTPRETYLLTAAVILLALIATWLLLGPYAIHRV